MLLIWLARLFAEKEKIAVGIDLGTTYSCVGVINPTGENSLKLLDIDKHKTMPSVVRVDFDENNNPEYSVGQMAVLKNSTDPQNGRYFYAFKRLMGIKNLKEENIFNQLNKNITYRVRETNNQLILPIETNNVEYTEFTPEVASSLVLRKIKARIDEENAEIVSFVITIPAYFNDNQRNATDRAAKMADLKIDGFIKEPVAAALTYKILHGNRESNEDENFLVVDIGGGTTDFSILTSSKGYAEVKEYNGSNFLGGENVNNVMVTYFQKKLSEKNIQIKTQEEKMKLRAFVEDFKKALCEKQADNDGEYTTYSNNYFHIDEKGNKVSVELSMDSTTFEEINKDFFNTIDQLLKDILNKYKENHDKSKDDIDAVLLVGGSIRIPKIRRMLKDLFGASKLDSALCPDTCVAQGAAYFAAEQAGFLSTEASITFVDIIPLPIGVRVGEKIFHQLIEKNKTIPATGEGIFTTSYDYQDKVLVSVGQGLRSDFNLNTKLGEVEVHLKQKMRQGEPQIKLQMSVDVMNNVHVEASIYDRNNNLISEKVQATFKRGDKELSKEALDALNKDYEANKEKDAEMVGLYEALQNMNTTIYSAKSQAEQAPAELKKLLLKEIGTLDAWYESNKATTTKADVENKLKEFNENIRNLTSKAGEVKEGDEVGGIPQEVGGDDEKDDL